MRVFTLERNYKDAKRISNEIKSLMSEGEIKQQNVVALSKSIELESAVAKDLKMTTMEIKELFLKKEHSFGELSNYLTWINFRVDKFS